jgi:hypothetical protein
MARQCLCNGTGCRAETAPKCQAPNHRDTAESIDYADFTDEKREQGARSRGKEQESDKSHYQSQGQWAEAKALLGVLEPRWFALFY